MPIVSLERDARYRRTGDRFVERCRSCGLDRDGDRCTCGATFERLERKFLTLAWTPTDLRPEMPAVCPHCEGPADRVRSVTLMLPTAITGLTSHRESRITIEVPSCRKMLPPFLAYLLLLTSIFFLVVFGLATIFGNGLVAGILAVLSAAGVVASWRAYGWLRFVRFDHRSLRFRARRPGYAVALAERNGGRVL
jgi:hypothetical protein